MLDAITPSVLDMPGHYTYIQSTIEKKPSLKALYTEVYGRYKSCLSRCPKEGVALEVGSGGGFAKEVIRDLTTSDIIAYPEVDRVVDATRMPFQEENLKAIFLFNVLHHIPDANLFFKEAIRCLKPGGRICITDQFPGWIAKPILKYAHNEAFDENVKEWKFESVGPMSSANGALPWIIFFRDIELFKAKFPELQIEFVEYHTPLRYWLTGGLKRWTLLPQFLFHFATRLDRFLSKLSSQFASFFTVEIVRK